MKFRDDLAAITAATAGDRAGFEWLVRRHQRRAFAVALGLLRDPEDARDACQEALLRVSRRLDRFQRSAQFSTWLHRIVVNVCLDRLRRRRALRLVPLERIAQRLAGGDDPGRSAERAELDGRIAGALAALTTKHRTALVLRELEGLSYQDIAAVMNCSIGTVMSRLFNARKRMQALLADDAPAPTLAA